MLVVRLVLSSVGSSPTLLRHFDPSWWNGTRLSNRSLHVAFVSESLNSAISTSFQMRGYAVAGLLSNRRWGIYAEQLMCTSKVEHSDVHIFIHVKHFCARFLAYGGKHILDVNDGDISQIPSGPPQGPHALILNSDVQMAEHCRRGTPFVICAMIPHAYNLPCPKSTWARAAASVLARDKRRPIGLIGHSLNESAVLEIVGRARATRGLMKTPCASTQCT